MAKELFEVDLKGNEGSTIKEIVYLKKDVEHLQENDYDGDDITQVDKYEIKLKYHNDKEEVIKFSQTSFFKYY